MSLHLKALICIEPHPTYNHEYDMFVHVSTQIMHYSLRRVSSTHKQWNNRTIDHYVGKIDQTRD